MVQSGTSCRVPSSGGSKARSTLSDIPAKIGPRGPVQHDARRATLETRGVPNLPGAMKWGGPKPWCSRAGRRLSRHGADVAAAHLRYHRWARRTLLLGGAGLACALLPGVLVPGFAVLLLMWVLNGAGQAMVAIPSVGLLADHTEPEERGRAYAAHFALTHLFWLFTYPAAGYMAKVLGAPRTFTAAGVFCLALTIIAATIRREHCAHG
jgi:MFS family permease